MLINHLLAPSGYDQLSGRISEKRNNKASAEGARLLKKAMLLRDVYKAIPGRVLSFWTHQQGLPRGPPNSINVDF